MLISLLRIHEKRYKNCTNPDSGGIMKNIRLISFLLCFISTAIYADYTEVRVTEKVCDGPFVNTGDISRLKTVIKKAKESLKNECLNEVPFGIVLKGMERITTFDTQYGTLHCLEIEVVDQCFYR
jgi:hypothetical protein